jgi:hypothetical protein
MLDRLHACPSLIVMPVSGQYSHTLITLPQEQRLYGHMWSLHMVITWSKVIAFLIDRLKVEQIKPYGMETEIV